jgi:hypothetical protein
VEAGCFTSRLSLFPLHYHSTPSLPIPPPGALGRTLTLIEALDSAGRGKIYPDLEKEAPYVVVHLERAAK